MTLNQRQGLLEKDVLGRSGTAKGGALRETPHQVRRRFADQKVGRHGTDDRLELHGMDFAVAAEQLHPGHDPCQLGVPFQERHHASEKPGA